MKVGDESKSDYHKRISAAMDYIQNNLAKNYAEGLGLEAIADSANMSPFHFHKVFKSVVGETIADYIRRLKLEKSAGIFFYYKQVRITEVAMALGFSSSQNLAKAFKQHFNVTPSDVKSLTDKQQLISLIKKYSKYGNAQKKDFSYSNDSHLQRLDTKNMTEDISVIEGSLTEQKMNVPGQLKISNVAQRTVIYKRLIGEYGAGIQQAAAELQDFVVVNKLATGDPLVINWDNPEITAPEKCRTDVCLTLLDGCKKSAPFNTQVISDGSHAVIRGTFNLDYNYEQAWHQLFHSIFDQGHQPEDSPCYKIMHLETSDPANGIFDISFCQEISKNVGS